MSATTTWLRQLCSRLPRPLSWGCEQIAHRAGGEVAVHSGIVGEVRVSIKARKHGTTMWIQWLRMISHKFEPSSAGEPGHGRLQPLVHHSSADNALLRMQKLVK